MVTSEGAHRVVHRTRTTHEIAKHSVNEYVGPDTRQTLRLMLFANTSSTPRRREVSTLDVTASQGAYNIALKGVGVTLEKLGGVFVERVVRIGLEKQ